MPLDTQQFVIERQPGLHEMRHPHGVAGDRSTNKQLMAARPAPGPRSQQPRLRNTRQNSAEKNRALALFRREQFFHFALKIVDAVQIAENSLFVQQPHGRQRGHPEFLGKLFATVGFVEPLRPRNFLS